MFLLLLDTSFVTGSTSVDQNQIGNLGYRGGDGLDPLMGIVQRLYTCSQKGRLKLTQVVTREKTSGEFVLKK
jgi:hypothetical protein